MAAVNSTAARVLAQKRKQAEGYRVWLEKKQASKAGRRRTRAYTGELTRIDGTILAEISTSTPESALRTVDGITLQLAGDKLVAGLPDGHSITVQLTTTSPNYGGVRWWYVCPVCGKRKAALYLSRVSLQCQQCGGLHYASQS